MPSLSSSTSESRKLMLTRSRYSIISVDSRTSSIASLTESRQNRHVTKPSHKALTRDNDHDHRVKKPVRLLNVKFLLTICRLQAYYSRRDSIDEHAECARRYRRLNDKYEDLKGRFSELRYF